MSVETNVTPASEDPTQANSPIKKRHRRTKAEIEAAKAAEGSPVKKRHRRTKAEIEAAKAAGEKAPVKKSVKKAEAAEGPTEKRKRKTKVDIINVTAKNPEKNTRDGRKWPAVYMSLFATIRTKAPKAVAKDFQDFCEKHQNVEEE